MYGTPIFGVPFNIFSIIKAPVLPFKAWGVRRLGG